MKGWPTKTKEAPSAHDVRLTPGHQLSLLGKKTKRTLGARQGHIRFTSSETKRFFLTSFPIIPIQTKACWITGPLKKCHQTNLKNFRHISILPKKLLKPTPDMNYQILWYNLSPFPLCYQKDIITKNALIMLSKKVENLSGQNKTLWVVLMDPFKRFWHSSISTKLAISFYWKERKVWLS